MAQPTILQEGALYTSRRNRVRPLLIRDDHGQTQWVVQKRYRQQQGSLTERYNLTMLLQAGVRVPQIVWQAGGEIWLSMLEGDVYLSLLEQREEGKQHSAYEGLLQLIEWLSTFYRAAHGCVRGDINLRNFLYDGSVCRSVDFEEPLQSGMPETDLGRIRAFLICYQPAFTRQKRYLAELWMSLCKQYGFNEQKIRRVYIEELHAIESRRMQDIPGWVFEC